MIYLPYSEDIRPIEEVNSTFVTSLSFLMEEFSLNNNMGGLQLHTDTNPMAPRATEDQIKSASSLVKRVDLKNFSVCQFANPGKFYFLEDSLMDHGRALIYVISRVMENQYFETTIIFAVNFVI